MQMRREAHIEASLDVSASCAALDWRTAIGVNHEFNVRDRRGCCASATANEAFVQTHRAAICSQRGGSWAAIALRTARQHASPSSSSSSPRFACMLSFS